MLKKALEEAKKLGVKREFDRKKWARGDGKNKDDSGELFVAYLWQNNYIGE